MNDANIIDPIFWGENCPLQVTDEFKLLDANVEIKKIFTNFLGHLNDEDIGSIDIQCISHYIFPSYFQKLDQKFDLPILDLLSRTQGEYTPNGLEKRFWFIDLAEIDIGGYDFLKRFNGYIDDYLEIVINVMPITGNFNIAKWLIDNRISSPRDPMNKTILRKVLWTESVELVNYLFDNHFKWNYVEFIEESVRYENIDMLEWIKSKPEIPIIINYRYIVYLICAYKSPKVLKWVDNNIDSIDWNATDLNHETALPTYYTSAPSSYSCLLEAVGNTDLESFMWVANRGGKYMSQLTNIITDEIEDATLGDDITNLQAMLKWVTDNPDKMIPDPEPVVELVEDDIEFEVPYNAAGNNIFGFSFGQNANRYCYSRICNGNCTQQYCYKRLNAFAQPLPTDNAVDQPTN